jgi:hypothetical protein
MYVNTTRFEDVSAVLIKGFWYNVELGTFGIDVFAKDGDDTVYAFHYRPSNPRFGDQKTMSVRASLIDAAQYDGGSK